MANQDNTSNASPNDLDRLKSLFSDFEHILCCENKIGLSTENPSYPTWFDEISMVGKQAITHHATCDTLHDDIAKEYVKIAYKKMLSDKQTLRNEALDIVTHIHTASIHPLLREGYMQMLGGYADVAILEAILDCPVELGDETETFCHYHIAKHHEKYGAILKIFCKRIFEHLHHVDQEEYNLVLKDISILNESKSSTTRSRENRAYFDWYDKLSSMSKELLAEHDGTKDIRRRLLVCYIDTYLKDVFHPVSQDLHPFVEEVNSLSTLERAELETELTNYLSNVFEQDEEIKVLYSKLVHFYTYNLIVNKLVEMSLLVGNRTRAETEKSIQKRKLMLESMMMQLIGKMPQAR